MDKNKTSEEIELNNKYSFLLLNRNEQRRMIEEYPILKEFIELQLEEKKLLIELENLKKKVDNQTYLRCNHIWIDSFTKTDFGIRKNFQCLKCGHYMRLYDDSDKDNVYYTNIESDFDYAKLVYESILRENPDIDDKTAIKYLTFKLSSVKQNIVEDYYNQKKDKCEQIENHKLIKSIHKV